MSFLSVLDTDGYPMLIQVNQVREVSFDSVNQETEITYVDGSTVSVKDSVLEIKKAFFEGYA
jgi:hypothetical protein